MALVAISASLTPVIVEYTPLLARKALRYTIADVKLCTAESLPVRVIYGKAYGTFVFKVCNKRYARSHDKFSIPFLDYFKTEPKWKISESKYGEIDKKNRLILFLDNIPRDQTILVYVDTEADVNTNEFVSQNNNPSEVTRTDYQCKVQIINRRDFSIQGHRVQVKVSDAPQEQIRVQEGSDGWVELPRDALTFSPIPGSHSINVSWEVDLSQGQTRRFRVSLN